MSPVAHLECTLLRFTCEMTFFPLIKTQSSLNLKRTHKLDSIFEILKLV